jgi:Pentapeptide repeats (8 copies)
MRTSVPPPIKSNLTYNMKIFKNIKWDINFSRESVSSYLSTPIPWFLGVLVIIAVYDYLYITDKPLLTIDNPKQVLLFDNVMVELHGLLFDLLLFGIFIYFFEKSRTKREEIKRLHDLIDDFRTWHSEEAKIRIIAAINKLTKHNVTKIDLSGCYLWGAELCGLDLSGSNFSGAILDFSDLRHTNLAGGTLDLAFMANISFDDETSFEGVIFEAFFVNENFKERLMEYKPKGYERIVNNCEIEEDNIEDGLSAEELVLLQSVPSKKFWVLRKY